ncbi:hypothetical protein QQF64_005866 [Cirrhinus molitorella]|uniref:Leishmanolysin-like peptidase n=1 Tax=Cirrhinus molitorella TaxID=172907 RepID=A0ABR3MGT6_9TELE
MYGAACGPVKGQQLGDRGEGRGGRLTQGPGSEYFCRQILGRWTSSRGEIFTDESPELFRCLIPPSALAQTFRNCSGEKKQKPDQIALLFQEKRYVWENDTKRLTCPLDKEGKFGPISLCPSSLEKLSVTESSDWFHSGCCSHLNRCPTGHRVAKHMLALTSSNLFLQSIFSKGSCSMKNK